MPISVLLWVYRRTPDFIVRPATIVAILAGTAILWYAILFGRLVVRGLRRWRIRLGGVK